jgi:hypothetical protein
MGGIFLEGFLIEEDLLLSEFSALILGLFNEAT